MFESGFLRADKITNHCGLDLHYGHPTGNFYREYYVPVFSTMNGKVVETINSKLVIESHDGLIRTLYGHMQIGDYKFKVGDEVREGDVIGAIGDEGSKGSLHLHYEIQIKSSTIPNKCNSGWGSPGFVNINPFTDTIWTNDPNKAQPFLPHLKEILKTQREKPKGNWLKRGWVDTKQLTIGIFDEL